MDLEKGLRLRGLFLWPGEGLEFLAEEAEFGGAGGGFAPDERDLAGGRCGAEGDGGEFRAFDDPRVERELREQRGAEAVRHHLHQRGEAGRAEGVDVEFGARAAGGQGVVAQAMTVLQQQQIFVTDVRGGKRFLFRKRVVRGAAEAEGVVEKCEAFEVGQVVGQGQKREVDFAAGEQVEQDGGEVFFQVELERGVAAAQAG